ncbi:MAG: L,D-transpeptidase [Candidatus Shapirobacteria bacterium]
MYNLLLAFLASFLSFQNPLPTTKIQNNYDPSQNTAIYNNQEIPIPPQKFTDTNILGDTTNFSNKRIEINLTTQTLTAFEDNTSVGDFRISSLLWNK